MRRLPVYLVLDCSGSMRGEPIRAVNRGVQSMVSMLRQNPLALETVWLSLVTFSTEARQVVPLTDLAQFQVPELQAGGRTAMGAALRLLSGCFDSEIVKSTPEQRGDWRPLVFLMSDGRPGDYLPSAVRLFHQKKWGMVVCAAAGNKINYENLSKISPGCVVRLENGDADTLMAFFKWVSASISTGSRQVADHLADVASLRQLPALPDGIIHMVQGEEKK